MHLHRFMLAAIVLLLARATAAETPPGSEAVPVTGSPPPVAVAPMEPAPGGGEMIVVAPERHYVTRGRVDGNGRVSTQCGSQVRESAAGQSGE
jgi:hypothetical protein